MPALNNLAGVHFIKEDYQSAKTICQKILSINPDEIIPLINLGKAHFKLGEHPQARSTWQKALSLSPQRKQEIEGYLQMLGKEI